MKIYWMFLILSLIIYWWTENNYYTVKVGHHYEKRATWRPALLFFGVLTFFCGLRSGVMDTGTYIALFNGYPNSIDLIDHSAEIKDKGFYILTVLYKQFISDSFQGWLFIIALISCFTIMITLKKHSCSFGLSCYLFIATTTFTYLINGMRQFIVVTVLFACIDMVIERQFIPYCIIVLLLSTIHASAVLMIAVYFIANVPAWSSRMWLVIIGAMGVGIFFDRVFPVLGTILEETQYSNYVDYIANEGVGANIFRLLIALVPCVLAFLIRKSERIQRNRIINLCVNMSVLNACIYFIGTFSSGMAMGRLTIYFDIYNLLLLPWLMKEGLQEKAGRFITTACVGFYLLFFYFQMVLTWNLSYVSDFLNMYFY